MNTLRAFARTSRMGTFMVARRTGIHQTNDPDDLTWMETQFDMSAEDKEAYRRQWALLKTQADAINKRYEEEQKTTRETIKEHQDKSQEKIAALEAKIDQLLATLEEFTQSQK
eukprot:TRINITY_DN2883_c0_g2_i1.p1 TRINITY_DN2883_c0_g2~~TRINITY_DN2883_c0_g2_i1.p1  ORF type:complete len:113 (+),score=49.64 TRINITY_DN2883_c0_g2_i1:57-395(+)